MQRLLLVLTLLLCSLSISACEKKEPWVPSPDAIVGQALPKLRIHRIDVGPIDLKITPGRPTILALWATWCEPCKEEIPALLRWQGERQDVDLLVLNVDSTEIDLNLLRKTAGELGLGAPLLATTPARAGALGLRSLPLVFLIDQHGVVIDAHEGWSGEEDLIARLNAKFPKSE